jgi:hypothetical protein
MCRQQAALASLIILGALGNAPGEKERWPLELMDVDGTG